jgi:hypothetical protein
MGKPFLSLVLEAVASGIMLYMSINSDVNIAAALWLMIWKSARTVAQVAGRLGMRAEVRYFQIVKL